MKKERAIELLKNFNQYDEPNCMGYWDCDECVEALYMGIEAIQKQPKRGKWIIEIDTGEEMLRCSECDNRVIKKWYRMAVGTDANKCPYCGARME